MADETRKFPGVPPVIAAHLEAIKPQLDLPMTPSQMTTTGLAFMGIAHTMVEKAQSALTNTTEAYTPRHPNPFVDGLFTAFAGSETLNPTILLTDSPTLATKKESVITYLHAINGNIPFSRLSDLSVYYLAELIGTGKNSFEITGNSIGQIIRDSAYIKEKHYTQTEHGEYSAHVRVAQTLIELIGAGILYFPENDHHLLQFADLDRMKALRPATQFRQQKFINALLHQGIITVEGTYSLSRLDLKNLRRIGPRAIAEAEEQFGPLSIKSKRYLEWELTHAME